MELQTERLLLREYARDDFDAVHLFASDPKIAEYVEWGPNTVSDTQEFLEMCVRSQDERMRTNFTLAITLPNIDPIGSVGLTLDEHGRGELGYVIGARHWGHGYATEAAASLLTFGKTSLRLEKITATCRPENLASARVLSKIGMTQTGFLTADRLIRGKWRDSLLFSAVNAAGPAKMEELC